jgi:ribosomal subunit interface protein
MPMEVTVHGRHVELQGGLRQHATSKVEHLGKYLRGMERAEVLFLDDKRGHLPGSVSCELMLEGHGHVVRAIGAGSKPELALDQALDKAEHRLTKLKDRLVKRSRPRHPNGKATAVVDAEDDDDFEGIEEL